MSVLKRTAAVAAVVAAAMALAGCATGYGAMGLSGGYQDAQLQPGIWRVGFYGNGYTTGETVQTYWLYHAAELTLEQGYDGFETVKLLKFSSSDRFDPNAIVRVRGGGGGGGHGGGGHYVGGAYVVSGVAKPYMVQEIRMLRKPFTPVLGRSFDAAALKATLEPYVMGTKCNGNVCPHVHSYVYPVPTGDKPSPVPTGDKPSAS